MFDNTETANAFLSALPADALVGAENTDTPDYTAIRSDYTAIRSEWISQSAVAYKERTKHAPHLLVRCSNLWAFMTGEYGIAPERSLLLKSFEDYEATGFSSELLQDKGFVGKKGRLAKYETELTKLRTERDNPSLSQTATTACETWYDYYVTGCTPPELDKVKAIRKGNKCEYKAIELYNSVFGTSYEKNKVRLANNWLDGECDIYDHENRKIIDIKCSWDLDSFKTAKKSTAGNPKYVTQGYGYLDLYDCDEYEIAYCLMDTPEFLLSDHEKATNYGTFSHLPPAKRIHIVSFTRDDAQIQKIHERVEICQKMVVDMWRKEFGESDDIF
jgi:hypothetical protein